MQKVIQELKDYIQNTEFSKKDIILTFPPVTINIIKKAEEELGFELPDLLKELYLEIGNGFYKPGLSIVGLEGGAMFEDVTLVELYKTYSAGNPRQEWWQWPKGMLPIHHWGCLIFSCLDCMDEKAPVFRIEIMNPCNHITWKKAFELECESFKEWLEMWLNGCDIWNLIQTKEDE